jgi:type VI secretion system secreted protein Hcp
MRSLRSGRALARTVLVAFVAFIATCIGFSVTSDARNWPVAAPSHAAAPTPAAPPSINAVLTTLGTSDSYFLKIPNLLGESTNDKHKDEIVVHTISLSITNAAGTATGGTFSGLTMSKDIDRASPTLMKDAAGGTALGTVVLTAVKNGEAPIDVLTLTLTGAKVRTFTQGAEEMNGGHESIVLGYTSLKYVYHYQSTTGTLTTYTGCWNNASHVAC